jgi:hypothetical protein
MENLNQLPIDKNIVTPLDPQKEDLILPTDSSDFKLPVEDSVLFQQHQDMAEVDPDHAAKVMTISKKLDENPYVVDKNITGFEKVLNAPDSSYWNEYEKRYPTSAKFLKESKNMAIAHDDHENIAKTESNIKNASFIHTLFEDLSYKGMSGLYSNSLRSPGMLYNIAAFPQNLAAKAIGRPDLQVSSDQFKEINPLEKAAIYYDDKSKLGDNSSLDIVSNALDENYEQAGKNLLRAFVQNSPQQALNIALGLSGAGAMTTIGITGIQQAASSFKESENSKVDATARTLDAMAQGLAEGTFESMSIGYLKTMEESLFKQIGKDSTKKVMQSFAKNMAGSFLQEGSEEFVTQIAQDFSKYGTGVDNNAMEGTFTRAIDAGLIGGFSGSTMSSPSSLSFAYARNIEVKRNEQLTKKYMDIGNNFNESKLKTRDPETHEALVADQVKGTPLETVHVSAEVFNGYYQKKGIDPEIKAQELGVGDIHKEATETAGDLSVPFSKWQSKLTPEEYAAFKDDIKFQENTMSVNENKAHEKEIQKTLKQVDEALSSSEPIKSDTKQIYEDIYTQLIQTGMKLDVANEKAKLLTANMLSTAQMANKPPLQFFKDQNIKIVFGNTNVPYLSNGQEVQVDTSASEEISREKVANSYFQNSKEVRAYIDNTHKSKPVTIINDPSSPIAEFDKLTGHLNINASRITNSQQVDQILSQFGQAKRESVNGKINANIEGSNVEMDAKLTALALARKLYNLQRLVECSRG